MNSLNKKPDNYLPMFWRAGIILGVIVALAVQKWWLAVFLSGILGFSLLAAAFRGRL
jgi:ABC-type transport system involved in cytochrome bd biosynthesis fused ATPase/permease subunit